MAVIRSVVAAYAATMAPAVTIVVPTPNDRSISPTRTPATTPTRTATPTTAARRAGRIPSRAASRSESTK